MVPRAGQKPSIFGRPKKRGSPPDFLIPVGSCWKINKHGCAQVILKLRGGGEIGVFGAII